MNREILCDQCGEGGVARDGVLPYGWRLAEAPDYGCGPDLLCPACATGRVHRHQAVDGPDAYAETPATRRAA